MPSLLLTWKALRALGAEQMIQLGLYRLGLLSGYFRLIMPLQGETASASQEADTKTLPEYRFPLALDRKWALDACQNLKGQIASHRPLFHWTDYERGKAAWGVEDVKFLWEAARFDWAVLLGWHYRQQPDEDDARLFWETTADFYAAYPPNLGPHWTSGQEVALRLIALTCAADLFEHSPQSTRERREWLNEVLAQHAERIPATMCYARAQNNNHLVSEAVGLFTAGALLPDHPDAAGWRNLGWKWFNRAVEKQVAADGTYVQRSTNYHRLFLTLAVWMAHMVRRSGRSLPENTLEKLAAATRWLKAKVDICNGHAPNLGHNDGARILPLAGGDYNDFRPTLQAASWAFLNEHALPPGAWDAQAKWLLGMQLTNGSAEAIPAPEPTRTFFHCEHFNSRPAHADQLHLDLWWRGINIALDAGTYHYNAAPPWENGLAHSWIHNTVEVDHQDQMTRAGRFLWLDWAQGVRLPSPQANIQTAEHSGYLRLGILHRRTVEELPDAQGWRVLDELLPAGIAAKAEHHFRIHWLLPDWDWQLKGQSLTLKNPDRGSIEIILQESRNEAMEIQLVRAGIVIAGIQEHVPTLGWYSPTYGVKQPALSLRASQLSSAPLQITTQINLRPKGD